MVGDKHGEPLHFGTAVPPVTLAFLGVTAVLLVAAVRWVNWGALQPHALLFIRIVCAGTFLMSAIPKLKGMDSFVEVVHDYRLTPRWLSRLVARVLPVAELGVGTSVLLGFYPPAVIAAAALLLVTFTVAIVVNLIRGRVHISCGCFGSTLDERLNWWMPVRNVLLLVGFLGMGVMSSPGALSAAAKASGSAFGGLEAALVVALSAGTVVAFVLTGMTIGMAFWDRD